MANSADESASEFAAFREMLLPDVMPHVGSITYESIADVLRAAGKTELAEWLETRLEDGVAGRASTAVDVL